MGLGRAERSPRGVFDPAGSIFLSLEFARTKGSKDSTSECVAFCLRQGVVSADLIFFGLGFVLCPVYLLETPRLFITWSLWCILPYFVRVGLSWRFGSWIFGSRTSMLLVLTNFTNDFPYRLKRRTRFALRVQVIEVAPTRVLDASVSDALCDLCSRLCLVAPVEGAPRRIGALEVAGCALLRGPCLLLTEMVSWRVLVKDDKDDDVLGDYTVEYVVRNARWTHEKVPSSSARPMGCRALGTLNSENPVIVTLERLDCDWGPHSCTFPDCGLACAVVLVKTRGAGSYGDMRVKQARKNQ
ncbi:hypothetical protein CRG98_009534 [Punica granatum]|uniref:Uncharacterized protein n=1 Tax=Punica granatum TaxID=22663 RepID=A0A2I0KNK5_PUNGR|nr:hypothetical protein CRG98_009534 [Punica granatum]